MKMVNCLAAGGETVTIVPSFSDLGRAGGGQEIDGAITRRAIVVHGACPYIPASKNVEHLPLYEGWNFNSGNYLFTTDTK